MFYSCDRLLLMLIGTTASRLAEVYRALKTFVPRLKNTFVVVLFCPCIQQVALEETPRCEVSSVRTRRASGKVLGFFFLSIQAGWIDIFDGVGCGQERQALETVYLIG